MERTSRTVAGASGRVRGRSSPDRVGDEVERIGVPGRDANRLGVQGGPRPRIRMLQRSCALLVDVRIRATKRAPTWARSVASTCRTAAGAPAAVTSRPPRLAAVPSARRLPGRPRPRTHGPSATPHGRGELGRPGHGIDGCLGDVLGGDVQDRFADEQVVGQIDKPTSGALLGETFEHPPVPVDQSLQPLLEVLVATALVDPLGDGREYTKSLIAHGGTGQMRQHRRGRPAEVRANWNKVWASTNRRRGPHRPPAMSW